MSIFHKLFKFLFLLHLTTACIAEEKEVATDIKVTVLSLLQLNSNQLYLQSSFEKGEEEPPPFQRFLVGNTRLPNPKKYEGRLSFNVFDKPSGKLIASGKFDQKLKRTILLLLPGVDGKVFVKIVSGSTDELSGGMRKVYNLSPYEIRGHYGKIPLKPTADTTRSFILKPLTTVKVDSTTLVKQFESYGVTMEYFLEDKWKRFISSGWTLDDKVRHHTFLYSTANKQAVYCKTISEKVK